MAHSSSIQRYGFVVRKVPNSTAGNPVDSAPGGISTASSGAPSSNRLLSADASAGGGGVPAGQHRRSGRSAPRSGISGLLLLVPHGV